MYHNVDDNGRSLGAIAMSPGWGGKALPMTPANPTPFGIRATPTQSFQPAVMLARPLPQAPVRGSVLVDPVRPSTGFARAGAIAMPTVPIVTMAPVPGNPTAPMPTEPPLAQQPAYAPTQSPDPSQFALPSGAGGSVLQAMQPQITDGAAASSGPPVGLIVAGVAALLFVMFRR